MHFLSIDYLIFYKMQYVCSTAMYNILYMYCIFMYRYVLNINEVYVQNMYLPKSHNNNVIFMIDLFIFATCINMFKNKKLNRIHA
jgi:hypothetical protein